MLSLQQFGIELLGLMDTDILSVAFHFVESDNEEYLGSGKEAMTVEESRRHPVLRMR